MNSKYETILEYLRKHKGEIIYQRQIARDLNISYSTVLMWLKVMELQGKVKLKKFGQARLVELVE